MNGEGIAFDNRTGVYSLKDYEQAVRLCLVSNDHIYATGVVKLWGTIIEHDNGYRSEFAKPIEIVDIVYQIEKRGLEAPLWMSLISEFYGIGRR